MMAAASVFVMVIKKQSRKISPVSRLIHEQNVIMREEEKKMIINNRKSHGENVCCSKKRLLTKPFHCSFLYNPLSHLQCNPIQLFIVARPNEKIKRLAHILIAEAQVGGALGGPWSEESH